METTEAKIWNRVGKFIIIIGSIISIVVRVRMNNLENEAVNLFMAVVNMASLIISIETFLIGLFIEMRSINRKSNIKIDNIVMFVYLLCFGVGAFLFLGGIYFYYRIYLECKDAISLVNDICGIFSLGLALTYNFIIECIVNAVY